MSRSKQVVQLHLRNKYTWFYIPWIILGVNFLINFIIGTALNTGERMNTGSITSIFIYTFVAGTVTIKETFPFALGLSIRRKDYVLGTILTAFLVNAISALLLTLFSVLEEATDGWGVQMSLFKVGFLSDVSVIGMLGIYLILLLNMYFFGFAISSIHRRFGSTGMYAFFTALLLIGTVGTYSLTHLGLWGGIFGWLVQHYMALFWWMLPLLAVYLTATYSLLRRAAV
ncbi:hypothetical protein LOZ80_33885 [Paenibacillus sp. HWE-109]|uniref:hypothetical protein n=1 Tax=Paenibacillus sp. HWE-109 TaxID=1306526 RepID=UPI001EDE9796|nr:hypothetical protein [Paenibacillus sp. HWE-109]UKS26455.1 hypothetical protein LOZ80_33885 [Paenibacillus sp. HWE-109]